MLINAATKLEATKLVGLLVLQLGGGGVNTYQSRQ
jgi:hypothetical protein